MDCSFKGVKFYSNKSGIEGGRNLHSKKIPFSDRIKTIDLGTREKTIPLSGFVIGPDHRRLAKDLISVLDKEGPGELTHPTIGSISVYIQSWTASENEDARGMTRFNLNFIQHNELTVESVPIPVESDLSTGSETIVDAARSNFLDNFNITDLAVDGLERLEGGLQTAVDSIMPAIDFIEDQNRNISRIAFGIRQMRSQIKDLINKPSQLFKRLKDSFDNLWGAINNQPFGNSAEGNNSSVVELLQESFSTSEFPFEPDPVGDLASQKSLSSNISLIRDTLSLLVTAQATKCLPEIISASTPVSGDDMRAAKAVIVDNVNNILESAQSPDVFRAVLNQRALVLEYFRVLEGRLSPVSLVDVTPSIVLAYNLSGSDILEDLLSVEDEIIFRNNIIHPGFIPASESVEVFNG